MHQAIAIDAQEDLTVLQTSIAGIPDVIDRLMVSLASAAGIPVTLLFGVSPGGFGTGEGEMAIYADKVRSYQRTTVKPVLRWCLKEFFAAIGVPEDRKWDIHFGPLRTPTAAEQAAIQLQVAQTDAIYLQSGVVMPEEVAMSRFGGGEWSMHTQLDEEMRERLEDDMEAELEQRQANNVPTQEDPQQANGQQGDEPDDAAAPAATAAGNGRSEDS
jgi:phage-related protein (TIGR01555 family)